MDHATQQIMLAFRVIYQTVAQRCRAVFGEPQDERIAPMRRLGLRRALAGASLILGLAASPLRAEPVDLELVLATDVSRSVDENEAALQRDGAVAAFRSPEVVRAIQSGNLGKIGVAYIDWSQDG